MPTWLREGRNIDAIDECRARAGGEMARLFQRDPTALRCRGEIATACAARLASFRYQHSDEGLNGDPGQP